MDGREILDDESQDQGVTYPALANALLRQRAKDPNKPLVLNVNFPGTANPQDAASPNYLALTDLDGLQFENPTGSRDPDFAAVYLMGVGANAKVPPLASDPNTLDLDVRKKKLGFFDGFYGIFRNEGRGISDPEISAGNMGEVSAAVAGGVLGAGMITNNQKLLTALQRLDNDGLLPERLFLTGYSRGSVNCISLSYEVYKLFGDRIVVDMCLVDPVPGPLRSGNISERIIAPHVESLSVLYAQTGVVGSRLLDIGVQATDTKRLTITNPNGTTLSAYVVPASTHATILGHDQVAHSVYKLTYAANGKDFKKNLAEFREDKNSDYARKYQEAKEQEVKDYYLQAQQRRAGYHQDPAAPDEMKGAAARKEANFYAATPIRPACSAKMAAALVAVRGNFDAGYVHEVLPANQGQAVLMTQGAKARLNTVDKRRQFLEAYLMLDDYVKEKKDLQAGAKAEPDRNLKIAVGEKLQVALRDGVSGFTESELDVIKDSPTLKAFVQKYPQLLPAELAVVYSSKASFLSRKPT